MLAADGGWSPVFRVRADTVCGGEWQKNDGPFNASMTFRRKGEVVARIRRAQVSAWWVEEEDD